MTLRAVEENWESAIKNVDRVDGNIILQGVQGKLGLTLIISEDVGQMSATMAGLKRGI